jgi:phage baseplate assembly protein W
MTLHETDFLGKGWGFPPSFDRGLNANVMVAKEDDIAQSLEILLSTSLGERFLQPTYGCNLRDYLFEPMNRSMTSFLEELVRTAILMHEPRIKFESLGMTPKPENGLIVFDVHYVIRTTNTRTNHVFPFYINEGTDLKL